MIDPTTFTEGQEFRVRNERGTFLFRGIDKDGSVRCYGGALGKGSWRNFKPDSISKVIRKKKTRREQ